MSDSLHKPRRFVLLDRDGTINIERDFLSHPEQVELVPGAAEGLHKLREMGLGLIVVTNQSGISRGYFDEPRLHEIHHSLCRLLSAEGVEIDAFYYCPHHPDEQCPCRKPKPGMVEQAVQDFCFDPQTSFLIGDKPCDIDLGRAVGATTFLVRSGYGAIIEREKAANPGYVVNDLREAADVIQQIINSETGPSAGIQGSESRHKI